MILKKFFVLLTLFPASCRVTAVENAGGNALENDNNATTYTSALFSINSILGNSVDDSVSFSTRNPRHKRDLANLYFMILFGTNCNPLNYNGYGCYCGLLGSGDPVDGIDRCCQQHDMCYKDANCWTISLYIKPYIWTSYGTGAYCDYNSDECSRGLCECDAAFTRCLRQYRCPTRKRSCNQRSYWSF